MLVVVKENGFDTADTDGEGPIGEGPIGEDCVARREEREEDDGKSDRPVTFMVSCLLTVDDRGEKWDKFVSIVVGRSVSDGLSGEEKMPAHW